jgi:serine/threonine-protein kinase
MPLTIGSRVGAYEVLSLLGAGGMGEVYRAKDTRLGREVALKILPVTFTNDPERVARFRREAQVLASLNHPNIGAIYGFEDGDSVHALVLELVDGPTLADRIALGAIPLDEALPIATQIAEALQAAHEQGIIHRDLKPANIKITPAGVVKVLDFGLARALDPSGLASSSPTMSPTLSVHATQAGVILGTAAYMPPEQAKGRPVDRRADLWSFGCVVYEMLTARRPFTGETISDVLAKVIEREPDWSTLPAQTSGSIRTLLRRCLEKDPKRRLDSAAAARLELDEASNATSPTIASDHLHPQAATRWSVWTSAGIAIAAAAAGALATWVVTRPAAARAPLARFAIPIPAAAPLAFSINDRDLAIAPDGSRIAYIAGDQAQLMVRALDQLEATPLAGIANARAPFLSPDGHWIGFFERLDEGLSTGPAVQRGALQKVSTNGGPPVTITPLTGGSRGATWASDDSILFATSDPSTGIMRVRAGGGEPEILTKPDAASGELDHYFPAPLPGDRGVLFTIAGRGLSRQVAVLDLKTGHRKTLLRSGSHAQYVDTGHVVYADGGALWAVRFDVATLEIRGDPVPLPEQVLTVGAAEFAISNNGTLAYVPVGGGLPRTIVWLTRQGTEEPITAPPRGYVHARLSPDGTRAVVQVVEQNSRIETWDFGRKTFTRLTFGSENGYGPAWTSDGRYIVFGASDDQGESNLHRRPADGTGGDERLTTSPHQQRVVALSPDGASLVFEQQTPSRDYDFMLLFLKGPPHVEPLLQTPFDERNATISPDGRWMAYESNDSGQSQIFVRPFPNVADARYQVSTAGGRTPAWSPDGRHLFFVNRATMMAAPVQLTPSFHAGNPAKLFDAPSILFDSRFVGHGTNRTYDVSPDGTRFLMIKVNSNDVAGAAGVILVQNWFTELQQRVPMR